MGTTTTNLGLYKPLVDEVGWGNLRSANEDVVDVALGTQHNSAGNHIFVEVVDGTGYIKFPELTTTERNALTPASGYTIYNTTTSELQTYQAGTWQLMVGGASTFNDDVFRINDDGDVTKQIAFQAVGITTLTTRTITMPDTDVDLGDIATNTTDIGTNVTAIGLNTSKVTNATHTVDVTGDTALTIDPVAITNKPAATVASGDLIMVADIDAANALKQVTAQSIGDLGGGGGGSALEVEDEGISLSTAVTKFNFVGAGVTATEPIADEILVTIPAGGAAATYTESFVNGDLTAGSIAITHSLGELYPLVQVYDNSENLILPDEVTSTSTSVTTLDLTGFGTLTGTYNVVISSSGAIATNPSYTESFIDGDLTAGVLTVTHGLAQQFVHVQVYNNSDLVVLPDNITLTDANNTDVDLTGFGTLTGTWNVVIISAGGVVSSTATDLSLAGQAAEDTTFFDGTNWVASTSDDRFIVVDATHDMSTTGSQAITGVGFKPSLLFIHASKANALGISWGMTKDTGGANIRNIQHTSTADTFGSQGGPIYLFVSGGDSSRATVTSYDSDGFTLDWTKGGSPTGTAQLIVTCFR